MVEVANQSATGAKEMAENTVLVRESIERAASTSEETSAGAEEISATTEELSAQAEELAATASEMKGQAPAMSEAVALFKLESGDAKTTSSF